MLTFSTLTQSHNCSHSHLPHSISSITGRFRALKEKVSWHHSVMLTAPVGLRENKQFSIMMAAFLQNIKNETLWLFKVVNRILARALVKIAHIKRIGLWLWASMIVVGMEWWRQRERLAQIPDKMVCVMHCVQQDRLETWIPHTHMHRTDGPNHPPLPPQ